MTSPWEGHDIGLTAPQTRALGEWIEPSPDMARVLLTRSDGDLFVRQGDSSCRIQPDGTVRDDT